MKRKGKTIFKLLAFAASLILTAAAFAACAGGGDREAGAVKTIRIDAPDGAPLLSVVKMRVEDYAVENGYKLEWTTVNAANLQARMMQKTPDVVLAPINVGAAMYNGGNGYRLAGVPIWGLMHLVSDRPVADLEALKGQTVFAFTRSGTPGITLRSLFKQYGVEYDDESDAAPTPDKVKIVYLQDPSDVRNAIVAGTLGGVEVHYAVLAEPVATAITGATGGSFAVKLNFQDLWREKNDGEMYPQVGLFFQNGLLDEDKAFLDKFVSMAAWSTLWAAQNPYDAGESVNKVLESGAIPGGAPVRTAVQAGRLPLNFVYAADAKAAVAGYLDVILREEADLVGGKLPDEGFYYSK